jgi:uncharacterized protein with LGFP repeats
VFRIKRLIGAFAVAILSTAALTVVGSPAQALEGRDFVAGNIISDERFFDNGSMNQDQIQRFLSSQVQRCASSDSSLPCLPSLVTSTGDRTSSVNGCAGYTSEGWESSARILWKVAQSCRINPQVLIVMLQKEQGLVTSSRPSLRMYNAAMGANCPDTGPCAPNTLGFFNQVYQAAWQLRQYTYYPTSFRHRVGTVEILFNPDSSCGSSSVNIRNQATANLYNYTPYQPNRAALDNLYGTGDRCSAYGNRNFWRIFSEWFGSPTARGTTPIDSVYESMGGRGGILGEPVSDYLSISSRTGSGTGRAYAGGSVYWTPRTGAAAVVEPFRAFYFGYGGATGVLGWPNSQSAGLPGKAGGAAQSFSEGSVYTSEATGTHSVMGEIRDHYFGYAGATGWLGYPTTESSAISSTTGPSPATGVSQSFENGRIIVNPVTGTNAIPSSIDGVWASANAQNSTLGWPTSGPLSYASNGGGTAVAFQGGSAYSSSAGTFIVQGDQREAYFGVGGAEGWLGWPTTSVICLNSGDCWQHFQNASILKGKLGTRVALQAIEDLHAATGGDRGDFGSRTSGLIPIPQNGGGSGQAYEKASVFFKTKVGAWAVSGAIRDFYFARGGAAGSLGFPVAAQKCDSSWCTQDFETGTIVSSLSDARLTLISTQAIATVYAAQGGTGGVLGSPTSGVIRIEENGGGVAQAFTNGSIYSSAAGTWAVSDPLRWAYFAEGGSAGSLGWPVTAMTCSENICRQGFQSGTLERGADGVVRRT